MLHFDEVKLDQNAVGLYTVYRKNGCGFPRILVRFPFGKKIK
jgi:hypothetical protein